MKQSYGNGFAIRAGHRWPNAGKTTLMNKGNACKPRQKNIDLLSTCPSVSPLVCFLFFFIFARKLSSVSFPCFPAVLGPRLPLLCRAVIHRLFCSDVHSQLGPFALPSNMISLTFSSQAPSITVIITQSYFCLCFSVFCVYYLFILLSNFSYPLLSQEG